jgi:hypothetical protein
MNIKNMNKVKITLSIKEEYKEEFIKTGKLELEIEDNKIPPEVLSERAKKKIIEKYINFDFELK